MTTEPASQLQANVDRLTAQLQAASSDAPALLLQRAQAYGDLGEEALAREDIARAAALVKDPQYSSPDSVAAVERAVREVTISPRAGARSRYAQASDQEIVDLAVKAVAAVDSQCEAKSALMVLEQRVLAGKSVLAAKQVCTLLSAFHDLCEQIGLDAGATEMASALASCVGAALSRLAAPGGEAVKRDPATAAMLADIVQQIIDTWAKNSANGAFKQQACRHGTRMYTAAVYSLSTHQDKPTDSRLQPAFDFYIGQIWLVGTLATSGPNEASDVCQGMLRLLTADRAQFVYAFVSASEPTGKPRLSTVSPFERLLALLGQPKTATAESRSLSMLISSQLAAAAKDPRSSANFPGYDVAAGSRSNAPLPPALTQLRAVAASTLDAWVQSTVQAERSRGLLSLAALYESGAGGELAAGVWQKSEWAEELWDQGEFDKPETQLALLTLADACSTDTKLAATMKNLGSGLVQALARKRAGSNALDSQLAEAASVVLAKWTGLSTAAATKSRDSEPKIDGNHDTDADPLELADTHIQRIILRTEQDIADTDVASTVERSVESLGYLCLKPKLKEHVVQNTKLLQALFSAAQKTESMSLKFATIMLIRNLTQYRPVLSEEQKRMQQLQQLNKRAQAGAADANSKRTVGDDIKDGTAQDSEESPMDAPEYVAKRSALVCNAGAIGVLVSATQSKRQASDSMKDAVAETIVSLATSQKLRGLLVQQGAVRALLAVLTRDAPKATTAKDEPYMPRPLLQKRDKDVGFALAKIAISVPPHLAFHDPREIVRLLLSLLAEDTETQALLMKFEALLALTNLASVEPNTANDVRGYMACELNGMSLVEICVLSEHPLVRRAATELICNLVYDPQVFERFVGDADKYVKAEAEETDELLPSGIVELPSDDDEEGGSAADGTEAADGYRAQRLHLLVALADVEDTATRSAASGALAVLSNDPRCCRYLVLAHPRATAVLLDLMDDDSDDKGTVVGFRHRAAVIFANAAGCGDTQVLKALRKNTDLVRALKALTKDPQMPYYSAAKSACEAFVQPA